MTNSKESPKKVEKTAAKTAVISLPKTDAEIEKNLKAQWGDKIFEG